MKLCILDRVRCHAYPVVLFMAFLSLQALAAAEDLRLDPRLIALQAAESSGLNPQDYSVEDLTRIAQLPRESADEAFQSLLTQNYARYAHDLSRGRTRLRAADPDWHLAEPEPISSPDNPATLEPPSADYQRLKQALKRYRAIAVNGGWQSITEGPELKVGMRHRQVEIARDRLRLSGDYTAYAPADVYMFDLGLDAALRRYQTRNGLWPTGLLDARTVKAMNVPVEQRLAQLALAMERWRWLPRDLGPEYVWINTPEANIKVVVNGQTALTMRAIVGHSTRPTPSLASSINRIVFNPTWTVPASIAAQDLLTKVQRDPEFLKTNGFRVYRGWNNSEAIDPDTIDWSAVEAENLPYRFVQAPGERNSLGKVKIGFDNPYDIYIHDTPAKGLFGLQTRTFSSGCIRLEDAIGFTEFLLQRDREWSPEETAAQLELQMPKSTSMKREIPIYVVYITSWVTADGQVHFRNDLYQRDAPVIAAASAR